MTAWVDCVTTFVRVMALPFWIEYTYRCRFIRARQSFTALLVDRGLDGLLIQLSNHLHADFIQQKIK
jgi:hypothetical protein